MDTTFNGAGDRPQAATASTAPADRWETDPDYREKIRAIVDRTCAEQGVPRTVDDPAALGPVVDAMLRSEAHTARRAS